MSTAAPIAPVNGAKAPKKKQAKASATNVPIKAATPAKKEQANASASVPKKGPQPPTIAPSGLKPLHDPDLTQLLLRSMQEVMGEAHLEWIPASRFGARIKQLHPQFKPTIYGQKNLHLLCQARSDLFECRSKAHLEVRLTSIAQANGRKSGL